MNLTLRPHFKRPPAPRHADPVARALLELMGTRDPALRLHSEGVARITVALAATLGLPSQTVERMHTAALLHDVGKLGVRRAVLQKPGPLSSDECALVRRHPVWGHHTLSGLGLRREARWVLHHHEQPDGRGYPYGLRDGEIAIEARILHVADAFEALTVDRPYRTALSEDEALATIADGAETEFDAASVAALEAVVAGQAMAQGRA
jgi:HD-GYP domain-containing protein (c-di-GMP phosphodiesterase class II)